MPDRLTQEGRLTLNQEIVGSNPTPAASIGDNMAITKDGLVRIFRAIINSEVKLASPTGLQEQINLKTGKAVLKWDKVTNASTYSGKVDVITTINP